MKISRRRLKQIIKEELSAVMEDEQLELPIHQEGKKELLQMAVDIYNEWNESYPINEYNPVRHSRMVDAKGRLAGKWGDVPDLSSAEAPEMADDDKWEWQRAVEAFDKLHTKVYGDDPEKPGDLRYIADALADLGAYRE
jgi:hypothetical protein